MKMSRTQIALWMCLVLACGYVLGALSHKVYTVSTVSANARRNPEEYRRQVMQEMRQRLSLSDEQFSKVNSILDETRQRYRSARQSIEPQMKQIHEDQQARIGALLSPAQIVAWQEFRKERAEQRKKTGEPPITQQ